MSGHKKGQAPHGTRESWLPLLPSGSGGIRRFVVAWDPAKRKLSLIMVSASTKKLLFLAQILVGCSVGLLYTGCETETTTTVNDGFGMTFQDQSDDDGNRRNRVQIDD